MPTLRFRSSEINADIVIGLNLDTKRSRTTGSIQLDGDKGRYIIGLTGKIRDGSRFKANGENKGVRVQVEGQKAGSGFTGTIHIRWPGENWTKIPIPASASPGGTRRPTKSVPGTSGGRGGGRGSGGRGTTPGYDDTEAYGDTAVVQKKTPWPAIVGGGAAAAAGLGLLVWKLA